MIKFQARESYPTCSVCGAFAGDIHDREKHGFDNKETNPKDGAATTRLDMSLVPGSARAYIALALTEGDRKYGGYNWRVAGVKVSVYVAACARHLEKWWNGEDIDPISKVPHLANAMASLAIVVDALENEKAVDDRPPKHEMSELLTRFEEVVAHLQRLYPNGPGRYTEKKEGP